MVAKKYDEYEYTNSVFQDRRRRLQNARLEEQPLQHHRRRLCFKSKLADPSSSDSESSPPEQDNTHAQMPHQAKVEVNEKSPLMGTPEVGGSLMGISQGFPVITTNHPTGISVETEVAPPPIPAMIKQPNNDGIWPDEPESPDDNPIYLLWDVDETHVPWSDTNLIALELTFKNKTYCTEKELKKDFRDLLDEKLARLIKIDPKMKLKIKNKFFHSSQLRCIVDSPLNDTLAELIEGESRRRLATNEHAVSVAHLGFILLPFCLLLWFILRRRRRTAESAQQISSPDETLADEYDRMHALV